MPIWKTPITLDQLKDRSKNTLTEHIGIEFVEIGDDYLTAWMPVDDRTRRIGGILHGGASVALAETVGSVAAAFCVDQKRKRIVGIEINANHIRQVSSGWVTGTARPFHVGRMTHVWEIKIHDGEERLVCISRLTVAVVDIPAGE